ncbi:MAG: hypothetical protein ACK5Q5_05465 [Planctomycetaceae bacterium]
MAKEKGFLAQLIARQPGTVHPVAELRREHSDLRLQLFAEEGLVACAVDSGANRDNLPNRSVAFEQEFQRHAAVETQLRQAVDNGDLGRGA